MSAKTRSNYRIGWCPRVDCHWHGRGGRRCRECVQVRGVDTGFEPIKAKTTIKAK